MAKRLEIVQRILETWYGGQVPPIQKLNIVWQDPVIVTLQWTEESGQSLQVKTLLKGEEEITLQQVV